MNLLDLKHQRLSLVLEEFVLLQPFSANRIARSMQSSVATLHSLAITIFIGWYKYT